MLSLVVTQPTVLKYAPLPVAEIAKDPKFQQPIGIGRIPLKTWRKDRSSHLKVRLLEPLAGYQDWFAYEGHVKIDGIPERKASVKLDVEYKSQLDNEYNPTGSCNVTSLAMCLKHKGIVGTGLGQLEDQLYEYMEANNLSRHSPTDLAIVAYKYGATDDFTQFGTIERCQEHLSAGNLIIIHGWFTGSGHIIVGVGYDEDGLIVHDPYGKWFPAGYDTNASGAYLHYSYDMIQRLCMDDGQFWVHYIS